MTASGPGTGAEGPEADKDQTVGQAGAGGGAGQRDGGPEGLGQAGAAAMD